ncbi:RE1-silencing transcription factor [Orchesella cincta]|uniref:RE1-silencing transcription factor n=1 Tax=Orchesella cincta TaxID=48709 RepID=A0A1D2MSF1_ORCCI|nr:RE1-silencing transcription factor [Orchesella cincta]
MDSQISSASCIICGSTSVVPPVSNKFVGEDESHAHLTAVFILTKVLKTPEPELRRLLGLNPKEPIPDVLMSTCGSCEKYLSQFQNTLKLMSRMEKRLAEIRAEFKNRIRQSLDGDKRGETGSKEVKQDGGGLSTEDHVYPHDPAFLGALGLSQKLPGKSVAPVADDITLKPLEPCEDPFAKLVVESFGSQPIDEEYKICIEYDDEEEVVPCNDNQKEDYHHHQDVGNTASLEILYGPPFPRQVISSPVPAPALSSFTDQRPFFVVGDTEISYDDYHPYPIQNLKRRKPRKPTPLHINRTKKRKNYNNYRCSKCPFNAPGKLQLERHSYLHAEGAIASICSDCGWYVSPNRMLVHHVRRHPSNRDLIPPHKDLGPPRKEYYKCLKCPFNTANRGHFNAHLTLHCPSLWNRSSATSPTNQEAKPPDDNANETQDKVEPMGSSVSAINVNAHDSREVFINTLRSNWRCYIQKKASWQIN